MNHPEDSLAEGLSIGHKHRNQHRTKNGVVHRYKMSNFLNFCTPFKRKKETDFMIFEFQQTKQTYTVKCLQCYELFQEGRKTKVHIEICISKYLYNGFTVLFLQCKCKQVFHHAAAEDCLKACNTSHGEKLSAWKKEPKHHILEQSMAREGISLTEQLQTQTLGLANSQLHLKIYIYI